jgi:hypothetical protein
VVSVGQWGFHKPLDSGQSVEGLSFFDTPALAYPNI